MTTTSTIAQIDLEVRTGTIAVGLTRETKDFSERDKRTGPGQRRQQSSRESHYHRPSPGVWSGRQNLFLALFCTRAG